VHNTGLGIAGSHGGEGRIINLLLRGIGKFLETFLIVKGLIISDILIDVLLGQFSHFIFGRCSAFSSCDAILVKVQLFIEIINLLFLE